MDEWRDIETAPKGVKLIAGYHNALGKWRTIMARYYEAGTLECDDPHAQYGGYYAPEGWYEESETHDDIMECQTPEKWQPLPDPPAVTISRGGPRRIGEG